MSLLLDIEALVAYLTTLEPPPSRSKARRHGADASLDSAGGHVFQREGCDNCHRPPTYTSAAVYDVGLRDELGRQEFNPPSLRGLSQRFRFLHDGRFDSLDEVISNHPRPGGPDITIDERRQLLEFLQQL